MKLLKLLFDYLLPKRCVVCNTELLYHEKHFCLECFADLPLTYFWIVKDNPAEVGFWGRCYLENVYSLYYYTNNYRKPIHQLKYNNNISIGLYLGELLGKKIPPTQIINYIVPVPLHWRKQLKRGYNQSNIISKGILKGLKSSPLHSNTIIIPNLLKRKQFTNTQTQKDRFHRWENVMNAFELNKKCKIKPKENDHILLVDDVLTTGATLEACCKILQQELGCLISVGCIGYVE